MKEIWEQALISYNLPFTLLVGLVAVYWIFAMIGLLDLDALDLDFETKFSR